MGHFLMAFFVRRRSGRLTFFFSFVGVCGVRGRSIVSSLPAAIKRALVLVSLIAVLCLFGIWGCIRLQTGEERSGNERHRLYENEAMRRARFGEGGAFAWCSGVCSFLYSVLFCPSVHSVIESFFFHLYFFYIYIAAVCVIIFLETTVC